MTDPMKFYFDFSSPFGFLASQKIGELARTIKRDVIWRPFLIGAVYQAYGGAPLEHPLKKDYVPLDFVRSARLAGFPAVRFPENFPSSSVIPSRVFYWIEREDPQKAASFAQEVYRAFWIDGHDVSDLKVAIDIASALGFSPAAVKAGTQEQDIKDRLRRETEDAIAAGVFGSPFIRIDGESYWGYDRYAHIAQIHHAK